MKTFAIALCLCLFAAGQAEARWFPGKKILENRPGVIVPKRGAARGACQAAPTAAAPKAFSVAPAQGGCASGQCQLPGRGR